MTARSAELRLFLDVLSGEQAHPPPGKNTIMLFLKYFNATKQELRGVGGIHVPRQAKIGDLCAIIYEKIGWPSTRLAHIPLQFFEEIKPGMTEQIKSNNLTLAQCELQDGDILCFQVELDSQE
jgi:ubiquitin carboxyl-terminal hydrolase 7